MKTTKFKTSAKCGGCVAKIGEYLDKAVSRDPVSYTHNLANILMEILCMSKEAIYRRLRGEVAFTFSEVAIIASQMGISLDKIVGNSMSSGAMFDLNVLHSLEPMENYYEILVRYHKLFRYVKADPTTEVITASNTIPYTFYAPYENLSKFRVSRWLYPVSYTHLDVYKRQR